MQVEDVANPGRGKHLIASVAAAIGRPAPAAHRLTAAMPTRMTVAPSRTAWPLLHGSPRADRGAGRKTGGASGGVPALGVVGSARGWSRAGRCDCTL
jgi:hypothetical protein